MNDDTGIGLTFLWIVKTKLTDIGFVNNIQVINLKLYRGADWINFRLQIDRQLAEVRLELEYQVQGVSSTTDNMLLKSGIGFLLGFHCHAIKVAIVPIYTEDGYSSHILVDYAVRQVESSDPSSILRGHTQFTNLGFHFDSSNAGFMSDGTGFRDGIVEKIYHFFETIQIMRGGYDLFSL